MDERLAEIEKQKQDALNQSNNAYNEALQNNQSLYNQQNSFLNQYESTQSDILDKQLAFQESLINQQKETARKNMETESKKAKNDYFNYINPYGVQAESMASQGLLNSGVSETSKLGAYHSYQNRLDSANRVMQEAFTQYDNDMNQARLNNDVQKAQNALEKLKMQLDYSRDYYNNKNSLTLQQLETNQNLNSEYYNRYNTEYNNYQNELARQEAIRQWQAEFDYQKQQDALAQQNWLKEYNLAKAKSGGSSGISLNSGANILDDNSNLSTNTNIKTDWYNGPINADTQYGTFSTKDKNGVEYQPDNVGGSKLKNSGLKVGQIFGKAFGAKGADLSGQKIWQTDDERYFVWDGSINDYVDVTEQVRFSKTSQGPVQW